MSSVFNVGDKVILLRNSYGIRKGTLFTIEDYDATDGDYEVKTMHRVKDTWGLMEYQYRWVLAEEVALLEEVK